MSAFWLLPLLSLAPSQQDIVRIEDLNLANVSQGWGDPNRNKSVEGSPITIGKKLYEHGLGTHAESDLLIDLKGNAKRFSASVGLDDETQGRGAVQFFVFVDGKLAAKSSILKSNMPAEAMSVNLTGAKKLRLEVEGGVPGIDYDHADWADDEILLDRPEPKPVSIPEPQDPTMPIYMGHSDKPEINGARVVGCSPNKPFLFKIPVSGKRPLVYSAKGLPQGLSLDPSSGIITGSVPSAGSYPVHIRVKGSGGSDARDLTIVCGTHKLALTPPMGWNSWNVWGTSVTADKVKAAADAFLVDDLIDYGYRFVNIDDAWEGDRDADGNIQTNAKFGDMTALANNLHANGILLGIYSSPGPKTCAGFEASYQHEQQDANTYAKWGVDYLKYDWCSYGSIDPHPDLAGYQAPYIKMRACLDNVNRDITFSLCQYGMGDSWKWARSIGGNLWRTTGDITDNYGSMTSNALAEIGEGAGAGPGSWNDPDMLVVGNLGWGDHPHPTHLKPNEQITHITMWSLLAAPLILGCDLSHLDDWTTALITNHDVIEVDQDPLGQQCHRVYSNADGVEVWARPLWDGSLAVGLINRAHAAQNISVTWKQLGITGSKKVRDLWERRNIGSKDDSLAATVPAHGAKLFKIG